MTKRSSNRTDTSKTVELIYESVTQPERSNDIIESIVALSGSNSGRLVLEKVGRSGELGSIDVGFDSGTFSSYSDYYSSKDVWTNALYALDSSTELFFSSTELVPQKDYLNSEIYFDWAREKNIHHSSGVYLLDDTDSKLRLSIQRGKHEGGYTAEELQPLNQLAPHLKRAFQLRAELNSLQLLGQSTSQILNQMPFAAFLLDQDLHIHYKNSSAEGLLSESSQFLAVNNCLSIGHEQQKLCQMVDGCINAGQGGDEEYSRAIQVTGNEENMLMELLVSPLVVDGFEACFQYRKVMALVMVKDLGRSANFNPEIAMELYGLTKTEALTCALLCGGMKLDQIVVTTSSSVHTVRSHLKHLLVKTDTNSQTQLVAKVLSGVTILSTNK